MPTINVGIAQYAIAKPPDVLSSAGLGSCVCVAIYDLPAKIGGLAHIMLPSYEGFEGQDRAKFADAAICDLVTKITSRGGRRETLVAKITGGAHMFGDGSDKIMKIGESNVASCISTLQKLKIPIVASDTGGAAGRTVEFDTRDGSLKVKTFGAALKIL
jgi:chemotaxis protein CheD